MKKGYLTVYLSLTLTIMLSLCLTLIEGARRSTIRLEAACAVDVAMNSVLAEYHRELFEQYNLLYIDSSYGTEYPSYYNTEARLKHYLEQNLDMEAVTYFDFLYKDLLGMELEEVYLKMVTLATDADGALFQKKAALAMKDDVGLQLIENVLDWMQTVEEKGLLERNMEAEKQAADAQLESYNGIRKQLGEEEWITVEIQNPTGHLNEMRAQGILKWVLPNEAVLSGQSVDLSQYISARRKRGQLNQGNGTVTEPISIEEKILFHEYLLQYTGHYGQEKEGSLLKYQAEYLLAGKDEDAENLRQAATVICGLREVANVLYLYGDAEKVALVETAAAALASMMFCPELAGLFGTVIIMGWAYLESLYDTKVLFAGGKVPLIKTKESWHYDLDSVLKSADMQVQDSQATGLSYKDYLHVLLYLTDAEKVTFRFMDLMEMDIRETAGNEAFRMDACMESIEAEVLISSDYGYKFIVNQKKCYE